MPTKQQLIDYRNAGYLTLKCPTSQMLKDYVKSRSEFECLVRCGWGTERAAYEMVRLYGLHPELTFSQYQTNLAQRILDGEFPWLIFKRVVVEDDKGTPVFVKPKPEPAKQPEYRKPMFFGWNKQGEMFRRDEMTGLK
jgi:hypothetical protein